MKWTPRPYKRDVQWKPFLRLFRRFMKREALTQAQYAFIRTEPLPQQGRLLAEAFEMPRALASSKHVQYALTLLVYSHRVIYRNELSNECRSLMADMADQIFLHFFRIFQDNNSRKRTTFFREPVIQFLWNRFRHECAEEFRSYLNEIADHNESISGHRQLNNVSCHAKFINDLRNMEFHTGCRILPPLN